MRLAAGALLGPYRIIAPIGAGGMGEVYRAQDTRLNRDVAIKVLPEHLSNDADALARFESEAKSVAALSHPNILVLHDFGSQDGAAWAVTELLEGETLRERLDRGALPWRKAVEIAAAVAEGLAAAHAKGITHRDIKPANIFLTSDGRVKILDFGLAVQRQALKPDDKTAQYVVADSGTISGTVGYMSPEQLRGETVGAPSDIFSLGCVLYEMVTGKRAFGGQSVTDTMAAVLKEEPPAVGDSAQPGPPELARILERCLAKNPAQRFHSAHDLAFALRSLSTSAGQQQAAIPAPAHSNRRWIVAAAVAGVLILAGGGFAYWKTRGANIDSVAVLPFVSASTGQDADWLSNGITENLIDSLSGVSGLKVMSRSAVFRYAGKNVDPRAAGREMGVRAVVSGRLMQRGNSLSVSAELVKVADNSQLWGEVYDRNLMDAMSVEKEIASQIAGKLRARLSATDKTQMHRGETSNPEAYQLYLKGRYYAAKFDPENLQKGFDYFQQAVALDPNYALAYDGLSYYYQLVGDLYFPMAEVMPKAEAAARKALAIDERIPESHVELGADITFTDFDWASAEREFRRAIELDPGYAPAHEYYSWLLIAIGRNSEALEESRRAEALDPTSAEISSMTGWWLYQTRQYDKAAAQFKKCLDLDPSYPVCHVVLAQTREQQGRFDDAIAEAKKVTDADPKSHWPAAVAARAYALSGRRTDAQRMLSELLALSKQSHVSRYSLATVYAALGDKNRALDYLEQSFAERSFFFDFIRSEPEMDSLRAEPRFQELVRKLNFPK